MRLLLLLRIMLSSQARGEPSHYEAFDFKQCLHWSIDNEIRDVSVEPAQYKTAVELANRQSFSRHRDLTAAELEGLYKDHFYDVAIVFGASAHRKSKEFVLKYGVCRFVPEGLACMPKQDFPLAGAIYKVTPSRGALRSFSCRAGCDGSPTAIHDMGYENIEGEKNVAHEVALKKFRKMCGSAS